MIAARRVEQQPAYLLHRRPFRDSSQILDLITRDYGRVAVVARGSRAAGSRLAGVLRPFLPLKVSWVMRSELGTLTGAESAGAPLGVQGDGLLSAYYVNELLLHFLHRFDTQTEIFLLYEQVVRALAASGEVAANLRSFEIELLSLLGYALNLAQTADGSDIQPDAVYEYRIDAGPVVVDRGAGQATFSGAELLAIGAQDFTAVSVQRAANRLLRKVIAWHLDGKELKSRKVLVELHRGRMPGSKQAEPEKR